MNLLLSVVDSLVVEGNVVVVECFCGSVKLVVDSE